MAEWDMNVGGYLYAGVGFVGSQDDFPVLTNSENDFSPSITLDNGLKLSAQIELDPEAEPPGVGGYQMEYGAPDPEFISMNDPQEDDHIAWTEDTSRLLRSAGRGGIVVLSPVEGTSPGVIVFAGATAHYLRNQASSVTGGSLDGSLVLPLTAEQAADIAGRIGGLEEGAGIRFTIGAGDDLTGPEPEYWGVDLDCNAPSASPDEPWNVGDGEFGLTLATEAYIGLDLSGAGAGLEVYRTPDLRGLRASDAWSDEIRSPDGPAVPAAPSGSGGRTLSPELLGMAIPLVIVAIALAVIFLGRGDDDPAETTQLTTDTSAPADPPADDDVGADESEPAGAATNPPEEDEPASDEVPADVEITLGIPGWTPMDFQSGLQVLTAQFNIDGGLAAALAIDQAAAPDCLGWQTTAGELLVTGETGCPNTRGGEQILAEGFDCAGRWIYVQESESDIGSGIEGFDIVTVRPVFLNDPAIVGALTALLAGDDSFISCTPDAAVVVDPSS